MTTVWRNSCLTPCMLAAFGIATTAHADGKVGLHGLNSDEAKARQALAVIDGATWIAASIRAPSEELHHGKLLRPAQGFQLRRPWRAYGAEHVIDHMRRTIAVVRALRPEVHTLAIGDLSAEHGGKISNHVSHRTGLDVDVGFYFKRVPAGYPERFGAADADLDLEATWSLLAAFARTAARDDGVAMMFLDYDVQRRLYRWARQRGTPDADLEFIFQYPRDRGSSVGLIRHWPGHNDHVHVRFKPHTQSAAQ